MTAKPPQTKTTKTALVNGKFITSMQAFKSDHISRLSSIIERLRKQGYPIIRTRQKNNGLTSYSLPNNWKP